MQALVAITPMARSARWSQLLNELTRRALFSDAACRVPRPRDDALRLWTPLAQWVMSSTPAALQQQAGGDRWMAAIEQRTAFLLEHGPDPFDWTCQSRAYDAHDVGHTPGCLGDTQQALARVQARTLVLAPALDLYNPAAEARYVSDHIDGALHAELPGDAGHASASGGAIEATAVLRETIRGFLRGLPPAGPVRPRAGSRSH
jgi:homoserine O-acetyltransferase